MGLPTSEPAALIQIASSAAFQPARLRLARELAGLSQTRLKELTDLSGAALSQFESGLTRPSQQALEQLATALRTPVGFFFQPVEETHEGFFRSLRRSSVIDRRRARAFAQLVHDLAANDGRRTLPDVDVPRVPVTDLTASKGDAYLAAREVRRMWKLPRGPVSNMVELLEAHGILVVRLPFATADVDAFSLPFDDRPVVVLGTDKADRGRSRFDAAHELGHLVMHGKAVWGVKPVEDQAHAFAAELLMPQADIAEALPIRADWSELFALKQKWQVSIAALLRRSRDLGRMNDTVYLSSIKAMSARGWRRIEPSPLGAPEEPVLSARLFRNNARSAAAWLPFVLVRELS